MFISTWSHHLQCFEHTHIHTNVCLSILQQLLLSYLVLQVCVQFFKLTVNIFSEAKSTYCLVSVYGLPALLVHKIIQWIYSVMLALSFLLTGVSKSNKCHCGPVPRETCIFHIPWAGTYRCSSFRVYGYYSLETSVCWVYFFLMLYHFIKSAAKSPLTSQEDFVFCCFSYFSTLFL